MSREPSPQHKFGKSSAGRGHGYTSFVRFGLHLGRFTTINEAWCANDGSRQASEKKCVCACTCVFGFEVIYFAWGLACGSQVLGGSVALAQGVWTEARVATDAPPCKKRWEYGSGFYTRSPNLAQRFAAKLRCQASRLPDRPGPAPCAPFVRHGLEKLGCLSSPPQQAYQSSKSRGHAFSFFCQTTTCKLLTFVSLKPSA